MKEAALWADAWYVVPPPDDPTLEVSIPKFRQVCEDNGRDPATIGIAVASAPPDQAILEKYMEQGVERAALWVNPAVGDQGFRNLEEVGAVRRAVQGN
jgi:alkanesulfonate monooxygenase SsuD/methylene tetrahydromethanopterin reductase-like flavin-dependent oxidoreductase (luciferase family)